MMQQYFTHGRFHTHFKYVFDLQSESRDTHGQRCPSRTPEMVRAGCIQIPRRRCLEIHHPM